MLVQGGWIYRAIKMCIRSFAWEAAYDVARAHATHLDTVLYHRQKYLQETGREETLPKLQALVGSIQVVAAPLLLPRDAIRATRPPPHP